MITFFELLHGVALLVLMIYVGGTDFAGHYGYLGLIPAAVGFWVSMESDSFLWRLVSLWTMVFGVSSVSGWMWYAFLNPVQ